jgi:hypothetical protein
MRVLVISLALLAGCGSWGKSYTGWAAKSCQSGHGDDCWLEGEYWLHKASWTYFHRWDKPVDRLRALAAYSRGCALNSIQSCVALIERHLLDDRPDQRAATIAYIQQFGVQVRSDEEVDAADAQLQQICQADNEQAQAANRADLQQQMGMIAGATNQFAQNLNTAITTGKPVMTPIVADPEQQKALNNIHDTLAQAEQNQRAAAQSRQHPNSSNTASASTSAGKPQPQPAQSNEQQRKSRLAACLSTDVNCEYGTSDRCAPAAAYSDGAWAGRFTIQEAGAAADRCLSNGIVDWSKVCYAPQIHPVLANADVQRLASQVREVERRRLALSSQAAAGMPQCVTNAEDVRQVPFWCNNQKKDCIRQTQVAFSTLECARSIDQFLYTAENQERRTRLKSDHDAECHRQFGY